MIERVAADLVSEARATGERRLLVLTGDRDACWRGARTALDAAGIDGDRVTQLSERPDLPVEAVSHSGAGDLLGTTHDAIVFDAHDRLEPNALGRTVGAVDGGGLFVLLAPPLEEWTERRDDFDETLAVPPAGIEDVTGRFRERLVGTLRAHPGIAIVDVDAGAVVRDGLTDPAPRLDDGHVKPPSDVTFPRTVYESCRTTDQATALEAFEALRESGRAVVVEADRGRGKSSAAGLAAAALASEGLDVLVTAPGFRSTRELFARAAELLDRLGEEVGDGDESPPRVIETGGGGEVRFETPLDATEGGDIAAADVVFVDEAAALPVATLEACLDARSVAFTTTVHGYEGAGRGFSVRFRDDLAASDFEVRDVSMSEPIRYAAGDPIEAWSFRALCFDAGPVPDDIAKESRTDSVAYRELAPEALLADDALLREAFGLLVLAHYRTEPNDLARLLDAPNVTVRALLQDGHVVSIAMLAREGGLPETTRAAMYEGERIRGNMLPDVLTSQLGDEAAATPTGWRVVRIATHAAARSRGLGSYLLDLIEKEARGTVDWLGVGYGATPPLLSFWADNGFSTVHLSTTRNRRSGEHSAIMLKPTSAEGRELGDRHAAGFADRVDGVLSDVLSGLDPDVVRGALGATGTSLDADLTRGEWRRVARMAYGPGLLDVDPAPFRRVALAHLIDPADPDLLSSREERLLVLKVLQARGWEATADDLDYVSRRECARAAGETYRRLVDAYGDEAAREEAERFGRSDD